MAKASMTGSDIKGFASAAIATALFIPYAAELALSIERIGSSWPAIAIMLVLMVTAPAVWMLMWKWSMRLMGERL